MKILLGCCTKHDRENFEKTPTYQTMLEDFRHTSLKDHQLYEGYFVNAVIKTNNKDNIGKHYNKVLQMAVEEEYDCVVLMHDDVQVDDYAWIDKLQEAFKEYDVVGLAGAKQVEIKQPALWHLMSKRENQSGAVAHPANDKQIHVTNFGPVPTRCLVLDGLFLAIKVSSLNESIIFDENIPAIAHHYDVDFCLNANKHKLKLTTWPIWVIHKSPGLLTLDDKDFILSQNYFLNKWKKEN